MGNRGVGNLSVVLQSPVRGDREMRGPRAEGLLSLRWLREREIVEQVGARWLELLSEDAQLG
jgi:hypothetical protein